ncbi:MAG TPA: glycosyltransferase [Planctomycetota bacterium]|nr:glycosyltransferase [Planctomycetota bacterium]
MSRIAIFSSSKPDAVSGNNATLRRIARGLRGEGHGVTEVHVKAGAPLTREEVAALRGHDILHALHAWKTGVAVRQASLETGIPYVVSITGTDVYQDLTLPGRREAVLEVLAGARAGLTSTSDVGALSREAVVPVAWVHVPKGVDLPPEEEISAPRRAGDSVLFLHVGGWRDVKNNLFPLEPLRRLARELPGMRLRFLGPVLDPLYHARWLAGRERWPFAEHAGIVPPSLMAAELRGADVILNTSHAEGGANSVLEAMAAGRAVLASDIPGNLAFIRHDEARWEESTGVLYRAAPAGGCGPVRTAGDAEDFLRKARRLALETELRLQIGRNARRAVIEEHAPEHEIAAVLDAYRLAGLEDV